MIKFNELTLTGDLNQDCMYAIAESVSRAEIVAVVCDDVADTLATISAQSDECDSADLDDGSVDVWGELDGSTYRLSLRAA